ncbi:MAG: molecular chaperone [Burkholderiaceae bacterium]
MFSSYAAAARRCAGLLALATGLFGAPAFSASLQVSPITVELQARQNAEGLWLSNSGSQPLQAQVRIYAWVQENGEDVLKPTNDMVVSPPMVTIQPEQRQIVRLVRVGAGQAAPAIEQAYRVVIDELPVGGGAEGVKFVLRYSVPIFVAAAAPASAAGGQAATAPKLDWTLQHGPAGAQLVARNTGRSRAKLVDASLSGRDGKKLVLSQGLYGYVLPGSVRHWPLSREAAQAAKGGTLNLSINEQAASVPLQSAP